MKYIIVKVIVKVESYAIEYGKTFDNENDAIEQAIKLNQLAKENGWADIAQFMVFPKGAE